MCLELFSSGLGIEWGTEVWQKAIFRCSRYAHVIMSQLTLARESEKSAKTHLTLEWPYNIDLNLGVKPWTISFFFFLTECVWTLLCSLCCCFSCSPAYSWSETSKKPSFICMCQSSGSLQLLYDCSLCHKQVIQIICYFYKCVVKLKLPNQ